MSLSQWSQRPKEYARLLNPAFLAALVWAVARGYRQVAREGLPYPLVFVALPIVLHKATREALPETTRTSLVTWISDNPNVKVCFTERATSLMPLIKECILFGTQGRLITISSFRIISAKKPRSMTGFLDEVSEEVRDCMNKAELIGRWFASHGDPTTVMALWGVAP